MIPPSKYAQRVVASAYVVRWAATFMTAGMATTACSAPVAVQAPSMTSQCEEILSDTPIRLLGALQRETTPQDAAAIAWGDPPIVLACGVADSTPPDAQVITIEGVDWVVQQSDEGTIFTTFGREPALQMRVPAEYRPEVDAVAELTSSMVVP